MVNIALVDDEPEITTEIAGYIRRYYQKQGKEEGEYRITVFQDGKELLKHYSSRFDIIFLDVEMKCLNGFATAEKIRTVNSDVVIIFITKMAQLAIKGYEVSALDFMVKPVDYYSFELRYIKAINWLKKHQKFKLAISPIGEGTRYLSSSEIYYIEVFGRHVVFHTKAGDLKINGRLKEIQKQLDSPYFHYCNRYCLVNVQYVNGVDHNNLLIGENSIPISRGKREEILKILADYYSGFFKGE